MLSTISYGARVFEGQLTAEAASRFDLSKLSPDKLIESASILTQLDNFVTKYAAYISLMVLLLETGKILTTCAMVSLTLSQEGIAGLKGILMSLCCNQLLTTRRALDRARKKQMRRAQEEEEEMAIIQD